MSKTFKDYFKLYQEGTEIEYSKTEDPENVLIDIIERKGKDEKDIVPMLKTFFKNNSEYKNLNTVKKFTDKLSAAELKEFNDSLMKKWNFNYSND